MNDFSGVRAAVRTKNALWSPKKQAPAHQLDATIAAQATYFVISALLSWTSMTYRPLSKPPRVMPHIVVVLLPCTILARVYLGAGFGFAQVPVCI